MEWSATPRRSAATGGSGPGRRLSASQRTALPARFEAVAEALAAGSGPGAGPTSVVACEVLGGILARDGVPLVEALDDLARTWGLVRGGAPAYAEVRALAGAWGEATLGYLRDISCEEPLTGLASAAHLRTVIADRRRAGAWPGAALVMVVGGTAPPWADDDRLNRALADARLGATVRAVFPAAETIGRLAPGRLAVLTERTELLLRRVDLLLRLTDTGDPPRPRAWVEGLPESDDAVAALLDELGRA